MGPGSWAGVIALACAAYLIHAWRGMFLAALAAAVLVTLASAGRSALRRHRRPARLSVVRPRRAAGRAVAVRVHLPCPPAAGPCEAGCGEQAMTEMAGRLLCDDCADRAAEAVIRPAAGAVPLVEPAFDNRPAPPDPALQEFEDEFR